MKYLHALIGWYISAERNKKNTCLSACTENDFRADADNPPVISGEQVSVDPDGILSTRTYGLPRNLV